MMQGMVGLSMGGAPFFYLIHSTLRLRSGSGALRSSTASTLVLVVIFIFDLIAFALAVAAEQRRRSVATWVESTARVVTDKEVNYLYCVYDSDIATGLGVGAFLFLLASQTLVMLASKCFCCGKGLRPGGARAWAMILFLTCWLTFLIAEACLFAGSVRNAYHSKYSVFVENLSCETLRKGVFGAGAAFVFFTAIVSELYYVFYGKADVQSSYARDSAVGMGTY